MNVKEIKTYLKRRILVQDVGGFGFQAADIRRNFEDLKPGPNTRVGPKDFFEIGSGRCGNMGMTLLEVMVALLIFCVGIIAVAAMLNVSVLSNRKAQSSVEKTIAAAVKMEQILSLTYDDPQLDDMDDGFNPQDPDHGPYDLDGKSSTIEWEVAHGFPAPNTKRIYITVRNKSDNSVFQPHRYDYVKTRDLTVTAKDPEID